MPLICKRVPQIATNKSDPKRQLVSRLSCDSWDCPACALRLKSQWRHALQTQLPLISPDWSMHTLTIKIPNDMQSPLDKAAHTAHLIRHNWDKLAKRLKRKLGKFSYVRVLEPHKSGAFHAHILISQHIPDAELEPDDKDKRAIEKYGNYRGIWRWGRDNAPECGFGWRYHVVNIASGDTAAVGYCVKYLSKSSRAQRQALAQNRVRRVQTSRNIRSKIAKPKMQGWQIAPFVSRAELASNPHGFYYVNESRLLQYSDFVDADTGFSLYFPPDSDIERAEKHKPINPKNRKG